MAGQIKANQVQLGDSSTATNNFVWQTNVDGTCKLARGNVGATTQDILTVDASGKITFNQSIGAVPITGTVMPAFSAVQTIAQSIPQNSSTKLQFQTKEFDTTGWFDNTTNYRYTPQIAGYYMIGGEFRVATTATALNIYIYKNGTVFKELGCQPGSAGATGGSTLIFLNGSTDYVELFCTQGAAAQNTGNTTVSNLFYGFLVARTS